VSVREAVATYRTAWVALNLPQLSALLAQEGGDPKDRTLLAARKKLAEAHKRRMAALERAGGR
jgi:hypothetical protein